jgi:pyridinium-3,5-bisthiocarboxylic acid mononucleotide nickel chelatase
VRDAGGFDARYSDPYDEKTAVGCWSLMVRRELIPLSYSGIQLGQRLTTDDPGLTANDVPPMRIAYLECFSGISGDMFLGALVDAGVPAALLEKTVVALNLSARLEISRVVRSGISATKVDVWVDGEKDLPREEFWEKKEQHSHSHAHSHSDHEHTHEHSHQEHPHSVLAETRPEQVSEPHGDSHSHSHSHSHGRGLTDIKAIITASSISESAKKTAIAIFEALGRAEAKIHNTSIESVHFHEVGAVDAMVDIICGAVGAEALGVDEIICSPLNVGGGSVKCAHGTIPVPAPATLELLADAPVYSSGVQVELVTPTGAAIVKTLASRFGTFPEMKIEKSGYGAGSRDFPGHPNVVRLTIGEASSTSLAAKVASDTITVLEANLDDLNPQVFGYVMDQLFEEGALDAFAVPVQMKKSRPGTLLTVLCKPEDANKLTQLIFTETTTIGLRRRNETRQTLARRWENVLTSWGEVRIKIASMNGTVTNYAPEYEDCRRIAAANHVPLKTVMQEAARAYLENQNHNQKV